MANDKVLSNKRVGWFIGPDTTPSSYSAPTLASLQNLINMSEGLRIAGTNFGVQATDMTDDRSFADEAGSQELGYVAFGGALSSFIPPPSDTSSIHRTTHTTLKKPRTRLAVLQRFGAVDQSTPLAAGQEINLFRTITDAESPERRQTGYSLTTNLVGQDDCLINYVIPPATPVAVTITGSTGGAAGNYGVVGAAYQSIAVTLGVTWTSSDPSKVAVGQNGVLAFLAAGTATITASYPR